MTGGDLAALHVEIERLQAELDEQRTRAEAAEQEVSDLRANVLEEAYRMSFGAREVLAAAAAFANEPFSLRARTELLALVRRHDPRRRREAVGG